MPRDPYHPLYSSDGQITRIVGVSDGRPRKQLDRKIPYYVRLNKYWYTMLERLLDVPTNHNTGTHVPGCSGRAALMEKVYGCFLKIDALARETGYADVDDLIDDMIETFRDVHPLRPTTPPHAVQSAPRQLPAPEAN